MARSDPADVLREAGRIGRLDPVALAMIAGDLEPEVAARYGRSIQANLEARKPGALTMSPGTADIWLGWAMARADPSAAAALFQRALESHDPALRLAAGSGLMMLGRSVPPFQLTAPPHETKQRREAWLAELEARPPDRYWQPNPLVIPVVYRHRNGRTDLVWLNERAEEVRREEDVWPTVRVVLPDGTFWSALPNYGWESLGLTSATGDVFSRAFEADYYRFQPLRHGGLLLPSQLNGVSKEVAPWGGVPIWAIPLDRVRAGTAEQGRFLYPDREGMHVIDRRGDIVRTVPDQLHANEAGERHAQFVGRESILLAGKNQIELHHLTKGLLHRFDGFTSVTEVRYQPEGPWLVIDASSTAIVLHPESGERFAFPLRGGNENPSPYSRWHHPSEPFPR